MSLERAPRVNLCNRAIFLDLDGTLAPFEIDPGAVKSQARRSAILSRLNVCLNGRLAVVSGRRIEDIDRILDSQVVAASGVHGLEHRTASGMTRAQAHPAVGQALDVLIDMAERHPGLQVEMKELSVALHYRARPDLADHLAPIVADLSRSTGLTLQAGKMVLELQTPGRNKGDAVRAYMSEPPFAGSRPVYVGDDLTDESAFQAVEARGGFGVLVGENRQTAARYGLTDVDAVLDWLEDLASLANDRARRLAVAHV